MPASVPKRIATLRKQVERHERLYRQENAPEISDGAYDALVQELAALEADHGGPAPDSPTQKVGSDLAEGFAKIEHRRPMYSIDNTYSEADLRAWDEGVRRRLDGETPTYVCEPKVDGVAISLRYENGDLKYAVTRGDGRRGDDVTANAKTLHVNGHAIPHRLSSRPAGVPAVLEVRGEVYLDNATSKPSTPTTAPPRPNGCGRRRTRAGPSPCGPTTPTRATSRPGR